VTRARDPKLNRLMDADRPIHGWYRFVLSFPPQLVRAYVDRLGVLPGQTVCDPFAGTGTTLVECRKLGLASVGLEANPMAHLASATKLDWDLPAEGLREDGRRIAALAEARLAELAGTAAPPRELPLARMKLLLKDSISPSPLHKALVLLAAIDEQGDPRYRAHHRVALADALVRVSSNLRFGPEVGIGKVKPDAPVIAPWLERVGTMADDLSGLPDGEAAPATVHRQDARQSDAVLAPESVDAVITSPPYPNEKDYSRTTRLETVLLGLVEDLGELRGTKQDFVRSNTRSVYRADKDDEWVADHGPIQELAEKIEARRIELGKTSGFERLYARVTKLYFGGMARHLASLRQALRPGARLAYVVGDQASYLRVMIRTGDLLGSIAESQGYEVTGKDLFRERFATATKEQLREEVLLLRWKG
jgi:DNA modification methylase